MIKRDPSTLPAKMAAEAGPIPDYVRQRFAVMRTASDYGDLCVRSMLRTSDGSQVYVICAVNREDDGSVSFVPLGEVNASDNPYLDYKE